MTPKERIENCISEINAALEKYQISIVCNESARLITNEKIEGKYGMQPAHREWFMHENYWTSYEHPRDYTFRQIVYIKR